MLGQTVIGGVQHTIAYVVYASPDGAQPSQNNTQCFRVVSHEALDILEQKRPRPLGVNGLDDAKKYVPDLGCLADPLRHPSQKMVDKENRRCTRHGLEGLPIFASPHP